jgi:hypothetical protein
LKFPKRSVSTVLRKQAAAEAADCQPQQGAAADRGVLLELLPPSWPKLQVEM